MPASPLGKIKMVAQVVAILALILAHGQMPGLYCIGQAALWVVVVTALVSAADYFRRFNADPQPARRDFPARRERGSTQGRITAAFNSELAALS